MAKKPPLEPRHTMGTIISAIALMDDSSIFESLRKDILEDLKRMCVEGRELKKGTEIPKNVRLLKRPTNSHPTLRPFSGTYVGIDLGIQGLDIGFWANKLIGALEIQFENNHMKKHVEGPYILSGPNVNKFYKTPWGTFLLAYTDGAGWIVAKKM